MGIVMGQPALAPFAHDWVGGDIEGLAQLASTLNGYGPQVTDVAAALNAQVQQVVGAAGWEGTAASAFTAAWERDSLTADALGVAAGQMAGIIGWMAVALSQIEARLEQGADQASAHGVLIGPDGAPAEVCYAGTGGQAAAQQWVSDYQGFYAACRRGAQAVRSNAAETLGVIVRQIVSTESNRPADVGGSLATVYGLLYDLLAGDSGPQEEELINSILKAWYGSGSHTALGREDDPAPDAGDADPDFGSVGLIDDLAGLMGTILNSYEDVHYYHEPLLESLGVESLATEAGTAVPVLPKLISVLAAGQAADGEAAGAEEGVEGAEAGFDASDPLTLAGVVLNDDIHNAYIEHTQWGPDVQEHGVVLGALYAYEDAAELSTFKDLEGNVTQSVKLNSEVSPGDVAIADPKAIGEAAEWTLDHTI
jgi:uncharacterized protein YukE